MDDYWYWEIKFHIKFSDSKKNSIFTVDRKDASSAEEAQKKLMNVYKTDCSRLIEHDTENKNSELFTDSCSKVSPNFELLKPYLKGFDF